jgi:hypothetical protein
MVNGSDPFLGNLFMTDDFASDMNTKLLIAPPEIGPNGEQGVSGHGLPGSIYRHNTAIINSSVTDEKFARIMTIFEAVSFDLELYLLVNYGFEGINYEWSGEPFDSGIITDPSSRFHDPNFPEFHNRIELIGNFTSNVRDGITGTMLYEFPSTELFRYVTSHEARSFNKYPYINYYMVQREQARYDQLNEMYPYNNFFWIILDYYWDVVEGRKDLVHDWGPYYDQLVENGLHEWEVFYNSLR